MKLHEKIKALRKKKGISQQELSNSVGIHLSHASRLENGHFQPSLDVLKGLVKLFDVTADYLIDENTDTYEVEIRNKGVAERIRLVDNLDERERDALMTMVDVMLTKQKMKALLLNVSDEVGV